jgi:biopolymer transport protein ExbB/TolQ
MIIQVQRETGLANRTIVLSERQVAFLRIVGSRVGLALAGVFLVTWIVFAAQSVRVPVLAVRIAELERDNRRIDSLQVALSRMHGRYEQVRQMLAIGGTATSRQEATASAPASPNAKRADRDTTASTPASRDTTPVAR